MSTPKKPLFWKILAVGAIPILATIVGFINIPAPTNAAEERTRFSRKKIATTVLASQPAPNTPAQNIVLDSKINFLGANLPKSAVMPGQSVDLDFFFEVKGNLDR